jgi:hypothetical protein
VFNGYEKLSLDSDHLDISYRRPNEWPSLTPLGSIKSFTFAIGDVEVGPVIQLGMVTAVEGEVLDWPNNIDPPHFHGSDQFRVVVDGEWNLINKPMKPGSFSFQESGLRYREHPGEGGAACTMLVVGDRRGIRPTILRAADRANLINTGSVNDKPLGEAEVYPHPTGPKGVAAINTSQGPCERGYLFGSFANMPSDVAVSTLTGVFGDVDAGPVAHLLRCEANTDVLPESICATELLLLISGGSCRMGDQEYRAGDLRVQRADTPMPAVISGADGLNATLIIADRRVQLLPVAAAQDFPVWLNNTAHVVTQLAV